MKQEVSTLVLMMKRLLCVLFLIPLALYAQEEKRLKSAEGGWALNMGAGVMFGGNIGIQVEHQILLKEKLRISPFVSAGVAEAGTDSITSKKYFWFGYSAGANLEYGKKHRVILGPHFVGNSLIGNSDQARKKFFGGCSLILGYKGTADFGLIWQVYVGDLYSPDDDPFSANEKFEHRSHFGAGLGYKF